MGCGKSICVLFALSILIQTSFAALSFNEYDCTTSCTRNGGIFNEYYHGILTYSSNTLYVRGNVAKSAGALFYIIQMQDSNCLWGDDSSYGSISSEGNTGVYELNNLQSSSSFDGTNTYLVFENDLKYNYYDSDATGSRGQSRFQVIYVPSCGSLSFTADPVVPAWDGEVGGVFVSVSQTFDLNGNTIDASAKGFRGGIKFDDAQSTTEYNFVSSYTDVNLRNAYKGEGSCGTPSQTVGGPNGYPTGDLSQGAPANAGGGGNDHNAGGGGGAGAGGAGGTGGRSQNDGNQDVGGRAGRRPSFSSSSLYAYFGGGGGAGDANNGVDHSTGLRGGGIIVIATDNVVTGGGGTLKVDGETPASTYPGENDGGGGGGGAGTVHLISRNSASSNRFNSFTISATGGNGVVMEPIHGPGGGGGGGIVLSTDSISSGNVNLAAGTCSGTLCVDAGGTAGQIVDRLQFTDFAMLYTCSVVNPTGGSGLSFINEIDCTSTCAYGSGDQVNQYWAGIATTSETSVSVAGFASYPVGTLFYIIQMQDSVCDFSNSASYGSISSFGETGHYEINQLIATSYDSTNGITDLYFERNLQYNYQSGQKSSSAGQKRFQVVYVPNCGSITFFGNPFVPSWDGNKGGVFASVSQNFNLNGYTISVNADGFRGASVYSSNGVDSTNYVDFYGDGNYFAYKGEGICGVSNFEGGNPPSTVAAAGYPNGDLGRGAPANGGGGGNNHNNGGGGGAGAAGRGGSAAYFGGYSPDFVGIGGINPPSSTNPLYAFFGGGGGAGHNNNGQNFSYGLNGGGIILIATDNVLGAGTLDASGGSDSGYRGTIDGGGGGGGGGTVMLISRNSLSGNRFSGFTIFATGGNGFYVDNDHGSGGGGGGGIVITTDNIPSGNIFVNGGLCQGPRCVDAKGQDGTFVNLVGYSNFGFAYTCSSNLAVSNIPVAASQSASPTRSSTPAISVSSSRTPTIEAVASATKSATPAISNTPSISLTATVTPTNNHFSSTPTKTSSPTISDSQTNTITPSISKTISVTASPSRSNGSSKSPLASRTPDSSTTPTQTPTKSVSVPVSVTPSGTPPVTPTRSLTPTASSSLSLGNTLSLSPTRTISDTPSVSRSHTSSPTQSKSESITRTPTKSITQSRSPSISQTSSITPSISISPTKTITPSKSALPGPPSATPTASDSPSISVSFSVSKSRSPSTSLSPSSTISQSESRIVDAPIAPSVTKSTSISRTPSKSFSASSTISKSKSPTNSFSNTRSQSPNPQIDASESPVPSPSLSSSSFGAFTVTPSPFGFISLSVTSSPSLSSSKTPSSFPSVSASNSPLPCSCNDNNVCTEDTCDSVSGECRFIPITSGFIACDDGFACTSSDQCLFGECRGVQVTCDDGNDCTLDSCDPSTGNCANVPITSSNSNNEAEIIRCNSPPLGLAQVISPSSTRSSQAVYYVAPVQVLSPSRTPTASIGTAASVQPAPSEEEIIANSSSPLFFSSFFLLVLFFALF